MKRFLLWILFVLSTVLGGLFLLALRNEPVPEAAALLPTLRPEERAALEALCRRVQIQPEQLRTIGGWYEGLLDHERNRHAVWIDQGTVRALRLSGWPSHEAPSLNAFSGLERLWLDAGELKQWPDLSGNPGLLSLELRDQPGLARIQGPLPKALEYLGLAGTGITDVSPLVGANALRHLNLAKSPLVDFTPLVNLALDRVDLSGTKIAQMPALLPTSGAWSLNLDDTPVLNPDGYSWQGHGGYSFSGVAMGRETREGHIGSGNVDVSGTGERIEGVRPVSLPTINDQGGVYDVVVSASIRKGRLRVWLQRPLGFFSERSAWFAKVDIDGFGFAPRMGYVYADVSPGATKQLTGQLWLHGPVKHHSFEFVVESLDGVPVEGFEFQVRKAPR